MPSQRSKLGRVKRLDRSSRSSTGQSTCLFSLFTPYSGDGRDWPVNGDTEVTLQQFRGLERISVRISTLGKGPEGRKNLAQGAQALGPQGPLVPGSPSGATEKVSTRELSRVLPPLAGLDRRRAPLPRAPRPGLNPIAR